MKCVIVIHVTLHYSLCVVPSCGTEEGAWPSGVLAGIGSAHQDGSGVLTNLKPDWCSSPILSTPRALH